MIKALSRETQTLTIGLTAENVTRIKDDKPIKLCLSEMGHPAQVIGVCYGDAHMYEALQLPASHNAPITAQVSNGMVIVVLPEDTFKAMDSGQVIDLDISAIGLEIKTLSIFLGETEADIMSALNLPPSVLAPASNDQVFH